MRGDRLGFNLDYGSVAVLLDRAGEERYVFLVMFFDGW